MEPTSNNVILLPATIAHYERELTKYLEAERYEEAVRLLQFLSSCEGGGPAKEEEWLALLSWLQTMFPETGFAGAESSGTDSAEDAEDEEQFVRQYVANRSGGDRSYGLQLIELLRASASPERQLMALEQLTFTDTEEGDAVILDWLAETEAHPMVQFKALQTLKKRGVKGAARFPKLGAVHSVDIEETPGSLDEFPEPVRDIISRVEEISDIGLPDFPYFARQTWLEFLAYSYGTELYKTIVRADKEGAVDAWAAALHRLLLETVFGEADTAELAELYGITAVLQTHWDEAYKELKRFSRIMLPVLPGRY
ncbi:hypothetical protein ACFFK0_09210 [Paenibacillus chartarius]|uniref:HEAT repeat domain-containing protein n=1 Tax=Paenibacillus chartarius TaxID=747481 RepID=A0ABV6DJ65_9BACL